MSKSKGNVVTPLGLLEKHSSDGVRCWAASARLGTDAAFEENQMKIGRRLAIKLLTPRSLLSPWVGTLSSSTRLRSLSVEPRHRRHRCPRRPRGHSRFEAYGPHPCPRGHRVGLLVILR